MRKTLVPLTFAVLALAACGDSKTNEPDNPATPGAEIPAPAVPTPTDQGAAPAGNGIPIALQGRWGMVPADCTSTRGDAKGLLKIDGKTLEFYESVGTLGEVKEQSATRLRATFAFTGEGMSWSRDEVLDVQDNGKTLIRREYGEDASPEPFKYSKCA